MTSIASPHHQVALEAHGRTMSRKGTLLEALERSQGIIEALRESEARARRLVEAMPAAVAYFDVDGRCRVTNAAWRDWFGGGDGAIGDIDDRIGRLVTAISRNGVYRAEEDMPRRDGGERHVSFQGWVHRLDDGGIDGVSVIGLDTTQTRQAELALRDREEMYALAMRGPNEGLWDWNPVSKELFLSARLLSILGFEGDTLRTTSNEWLELVHVEDRRRYEAAVVAHLKGRTDHFECEYRVADRNGDYRWILARGLAVRGGDGVCRRMVGSIGDISDLKRRERQVRASEARLRTLVGLAGNIFLVLDRDGRVLEANREAERVLTGVEGDIIGLPWQAVMGEVVASAFGRQLFQAACGRAIRGFQHTLRPDSDDPRILLWNFDRFDSHGAAGRETLLICAGQDITSLKRAELTLRDANGVLERHVAERTAALTQEIAERRRAEADLIKTKEAAELANRSKSDFLANMSHELRTPLNAIIGFSEMVRGQMVGPVGNPKYVEYADVISQSAHHLLAVINDLLDVAKIESGSFQIHLGAVDVGAVARAALPLVAERARSGGVGLEIRVDEDTPLAHGDAVRIKQILLNLLTNAVKFTDPGGRVVLSIGGDGAGFVTIDVTDTGCGMSDDDLVVAMRPFGQVDTNVGRRAGGTGLGLPLTRRFTELHGGRFSIDSAPGVGTTVRVGLPEYVEVGTDALVCGDWREA